jgi:niacin transporter
MSNNELRQIPLTALFAAAAVILPQFFHLLGLGPMFLPMFLPIMLGSFLLTWKFALVLAILPPLVSFGITGMPPLVPPILPIMLAELTVIALLISIITVHLKKTFWLALPIAILADRLLLFMIVSWIAPLFGYNHPIFTLALVGSGIPGIIMQIIVIPLALKLIYQKYPQWRPDYNIE